MTLIGYQYILRVRIAGIESKCIDCFRNSLVLAAVCAIWKQFRTLASPAVMKLRFRSKSCQRSNFSNCTVELLIFALYY